jgi:ADP-heptose:LPS heptosyltransferase
VVHTGGIGDFLLTCPALKRLAETGPIELLGRPDRLELAVAAGIARAAHDIEQSGFESVFTSPNTRLRGLLARFQRCIVWMRDGGPIRRALTECGLADVQVYPGLPPKDWTSHASDYYAHCLNYDSVPPLRLDIAPSKPPHDAVIHPGSGSPRKNWPRERFDELANALSLRGRRVTWCAGPAEQKLTIPNAAILRTASLLELARALAASRLYIGNDSGITHLAAATGCPTVAIFGPTNPAVWAPRGSHVTVAHGTPWPDIDAVLVRIPD